MNRFRFEAYTGIQLHAQFRSQNDVSGRIRDVLFHGPRLLFCTYKEETAIREVILAAKKNNTESRGQCTSQEDDLVDLLDNDAAPEK